MTKKRRLTTEEVLQQTRAALGRFDLEHPEIAFRADDEAFLGPDVAALFADEAKAAWAIGYALQIVVAELRGGEAPPDQEILDIEDDELWQLYERREAIDSERVRRAIDVLNEAGFMIPPEFRDEEEDDEEDK